VGVGTSSPATTLDVNGDVTITDKIIHAGNTNTAIRFPAVDTVTVETNGAERARIDSSGRLLVGTSTAFPVRISTSVITPRQQLAGTTGSDSSFVLGCANTIDTTAAFHWFAKFASSTVNDNTTVVNTDELLGTITWSGSDGTNQTQAAHIRCQVDGTPGADDMPGRLVFSVTADGASSPTEALRISNNRAITVSDGGNVVLGTTTGTKIGTGTTQKIGFYNATPVVQPTAVADATDAASVITQLNALLTRMRNLGLIAT
jgi:hypothetical protein